MKKEIQMTESDFDKIMEIIKDLQNQYAKYMLEQGINNVGISNSLLKIDVLYQEAINNLYKSDLDKNSKLLGHIMVRKQFHQSMSDNSLYFSELRDFVSDLDKEIEKDSEFKKELSHDISEEMKKLGKDIGKITDKEFNEWKETDEYKDLMKAAVENKKEMDRIKKDSLGEKIEWETKETDDINMMKENLEDVSEEVSNKSGNLWEEISKNYDLNDEKSVDNSKENEK